MSALQKPAQSISLKNPKETQVKDMEAENSNIPLVSVVIASYNMGQYITQAVDSVLQQHWPNLEVIVVDDGSTDNTPEVMAAYDGDKRVRYIRNENQGQPKAKNCGINHTRGEFIAFCDADDLWEPNKLIVQMPLFVNPNVGVVYSETSNIDEHNRRYDNEANLNRFTGKVTAPLLLRNFIPFGTAVIRRECVEKNGVFNENFRMGIDWDLWLRYSLDWEFAYTEERTYIYRVWPGQMSHNYIGRYDFAFKILNHFVATHGNKLDPKLVRKAWGQMYIDKANAYAKNEKTILQPIKYILKGLSLAPFNLHGWKSLIKVIIRRY